MAACLCGRGQGRTNQMADYQSVKCLDSVSAVYVSVLDCGNFKDRGVNEFSKIFVHHLMVTGEK